MNEANQHGHQTVTASQGRAAGRRWVFVRDFYAIPTSHPPIPSLSSRFVTTFADYLYLDVGGQTVSAVSRDSIVSQVYDSLVSHPVQIISLDLHGNVPGREGGGFSAHVISSLNLTQNPDGSFSFVGIGPNWSDGSFEILQTLDSLSVAVKINFYELLLKSVHNLLFSVRFLRNLAGNIRKCIFQIKKVSVFSFFARNFREVYSFKWSRDSFHKHINGKTVDQIA